VIVHGYFSHLRIRQSTEPHLLNSGVLKRTSEAVEALGPEDADNNRAGENRSDSRFKCLKNIYLDKSWTTAELAHFEIAEARKKQPKASKIAVSPADLDGVASGTALVLISR